MKAQEEAKKASGILSHGGDGVSGMPRRESMPPVPRVPQYYQNQTQQQPAIAPKPQYSPSGYHPGQLAPVPQINAPSRSHSPAMPSSMSYPPATDPYGNPVFAQSNPGLRPVSVQPGDRFRLKPPTNVGHPSPQPSPQHQPRRASDSNFASSALADPAVKNARRQSFALQDQGAVFSPDLGQMKTPRPQQGASVQSNEFLPPAERKKRQSESQPGQYKGAETFEQMGFMSKPVKDDNDCRIM